MSKEANAPITFGPFYLFLDFDGVLHAADSGMTDVFAFADRLGTALARHPEVQVVVSSSWREVYSFDDLREFCGPCLGARIVGVTPVFKRTNEALAKPRLRLRAGDRAPLWNCAVDPERPWYERFEEISAWLTLCAPAPQFPQKAIARRDWAALDDMASWFPPGCTQLIHVADGRGLGEQHVEQLDALVLRHRQTLG